MAAKDKGWGTASKHSDGGFQVAIKTHSLSHCQYVNFNFRFQPSSFPASISCDASGSRNAFRVRSKPCFVSVPNAILGRDYRCLGGMHDVSFDGAVRNDR